MNFRSRRKHHAKALGIKALGINGVLIALAFASFESIWPVYIHNIFPSSSQVGFVTAILSIISLLGFAFLFPVFKKFSARKVLFFSVGMNAVGIALFAFIQNPVVFFILAIVNALIITLRTQAFGILVRENSSLKKINADENEMYMLLNIGWVIGPLLAGFVADSLGVNSVMVLSSLFLLFSVYSITMYGSAIEKKKKPIKMKHVSPLKNVFHYFKNKKRTVSYILTCGIELWWSIPYIFIPVEIIKAGLPIYYVGIFLFILCIPNIIVEQYMRKVITKDILNIITLGYIIVFICGIAAALAGNIYGMMVFVILASFGMGFLEPAVESQFFSVVSEEQATRYYGSFFTAKTVGGFLGRLGIASILLILPLTVAVSVVSLLMFALAIIAAKNKIKQDRVASCG